MNKYCSTLLVVCFGLLIGCEPPPIKSVLVKTPPPPAMVTADASAPIAAIPVEASTPVVPEVKNNLTSFSGEHWAFKTPTGSWQKVDTHREDVLVFIRNQSEGRSILFLGQEFKETASAFTAAVLVNTTENGGKVLSKKETTINGNVFTYVTTINANPKVPTGAYLWITVKDNVGYVFACGGPIADDLSSACAAIADTIELK